MKIIRFLPLLIFSAFFCVGEAKSQIVVGESNTTTVTAPKPATIMGPTEICDGHETTLKVDGEFESFEWNTGSKERYIKVSKEGVYEVTAKTKGGCTFTTSVTVRVLPCL